MITLSLDKAHTYVLQVLDELKNADELPMIVESEGLDTYKLTEGYIEEAAFKAHKEAPSLLVDGVKGAQEPVKEEEKQADVDYDYRISFDNDGHIATIVMLRETARLASIKASDSTVVIVDYASEESPIGRMQNNEYVRGTYDDPRLIVKKVWSDNRKPEFLYYSTISDAATFDLEYIPWINIENGGITISDKLEYAVLNLLASMVLDALSLHEKAALYKAKYQEYLQISR